LGSGFSGTYADDGTADTLTITDKSSGGIATVALTNGATTAAIVDALNTEFATRKAHQIETNGQLFSDAGGTIPVTEATTFASLFAAGGAPANVVAGDTISLIGTRHGGAAFETTFTIADPATTTIGDLVNQLQQDFGSGATVSVSNGKINVEATTEGASSMALALSAGNEGGGSLNFGGTDVAVKGRQVLGLEATAVGNEIQINHGAYGAGQGFELAFTAGGSDGTGQLGLNTGAYDGVDVEGTIGGYAATGTGRALIGSDGTPVNGLHIEYLGEATGSAGQIQLTVGVGALLERTMERILDIESGVLTVKETGLQTRNDRLVDRVGRLENRLELRRQQILQQFFRMEELVARFQSQQQMLSGFITNSLGRSSQ
jgi:flagellar hook-associated protein 2